MKTMSIATTLLAILSILLEVGLRYWIEEPWIGRLNLFIFMAEGNIKEKHLSSLPTTLTFIIMTLILLIIAIIFFNLSKQKVQR